jgi:hypothetical protein
VGLADVMQTFSLALMVGLILWSVVLITEEENGD